MKGTVTDVKVTWNERTIVKEIVSVAVSVRGCVCENNTMKSSFETIHVLATQVYRNYLLRMP